MLEGLKDTRVPAIPYTSELRTFTRNMPPAAKSTPSGTCFWSTWLRPHYNRYPAWSRGISTSAISSSRSARAAPSFTVSRGSFSASRLQRDRSLAKAHRHLRAFIAQHTPVASELTSHLKPWAFRVHPGMPRAVLQVPPLSLQRLRAAHAQLRQAMPRPSSLRWSRTAPCHTSTYNCKCIPR